MVTIFIVTMFFSCESDIKKVQQLSETSFIPTGEADTLNLKYTDSGKIKSILKNPQDSVKAVVSLQDENAKLKKHGRIRASAVARR